MVDMLKSSQSEDQRKRDEAQFYGIQQQLDDLRRQLRENIARQQWSEELYKQGEGKISQLQTAQDRMSQDVAQTLHTRQIEEGRMKAQISELVQRADAPEKQLRELRAQIQELAESRKTDRDSDSVSQRQIEDLQRQIREINARIAQVGESQRQLRDIIHDLDSTIGEVRQEALHLGELQSLEEQRLRRQGVELQGLFETLKQQFNEIASKSQRVDDVKRQLIERIEAVEDRLAPINDKDTAINTELERIEALETEHYISQQERLETIRVQIDAQLSEMRQLNDQRVDRSMNRFITQDERLRVIEQALSELPSRFEALERKDEMIGSEADTIEEWLVMRQLAAMENVLEDVRKRRAGRAATLNSNPKPREEQPAAPGSIYNPSGLLKSVRDAKPPAREIDDEEE